MASPDQLQLFRLFQKVAPAALFEQLCQEQGDPIRRGIYSAAVVVWMMIWQRLQSNRSLVAAVQCLIQGGAGDLVPDCKRWSEERVSGATGGYCQARQRLPTLIARRVSERIFSQLQRQMQEEGGQGPRPLYVIDGSSVQLPHAESLVKAFPPGHNQHGENHWPMMRIVVLHDAFSGLALPPAWGPMYGRQAVSEQALAEQALARLPGEAVVLGDGNFGIFNFAYAVVQSQRGMVLRLTQARAQKILGGQGEKGVDRKVVWAPSRFDRKAHSQLPDEAMVEGRVMVYENPSRRGELLYLFTTLDLTGEEILSLYQQRWHVETDLRSLKRTVGLHQLSSKRPDMVEKELLLAMAAYNLIRAVIWLAARRANLTPRQLSFSFVKNVVEAAAPGLEQATSQAEYQRRLDRMLRYAAQGKHPNRPHPRSYPRAVWGKGGHFPARHSNEKVPEPQP
jgi:putative transposase